MGLDIASVTMNFLPRPEGAAYDFAWSLPEHCSVWSDGNAFGFFLRSHMHRAAADYIEQNDLSLPDQKTVLDWVESLPYDDSGYITLHFNW